ncbi:MAG: hypothetical protein JWN13_2820 [Betaproteobacteria bacterium]|jgi:hypothetical protein|nr:hypothetical protein [Betaproteobacteria bacterium]MEA3152456.1 hypothetical protein [Betaproteobacteria bacterium]
MAGNRSLLHDDNRIHVDDESECRYWSETLGSQP